MAAHRSTRGDGPTEFVFVEDRQVLADDVGRHAGEQWQSLAGELGGQQPHLLEAVDVAVD